MWTANTRNLSHIAMFRILRVLSGKQSLESCRAGRRMVLSGMSLCPLAFSLASRSVTRQRFRLCFQLSHRWCRFECLRPIFPWMIFYDRLNRVHGLTGIPKCLIFCMRFLLKSLNICTRNPEARFLRIQFSARNSFPVGFLYLSLAWTFQTTSLSLTTKYSKSHNSLRFLQFLF